MEPSLNIHPSYDVKTPIEEDYKTRERWNGAHNAHNTGALSGSPAEEVFRHHHLTELIKPNIVVLDIGVGLGQMSQCLSEMGCIVDALDVADAAEATVKDYIRNFYLDEHCNKLPTEEYDVAISHIVAQHQTERMIKRQVKEVFRALKPGGVFSLHSAVSTDEKNVPNNIPGPIPPGRDGAMCRTTDHFRAMIEQVLRDEFGLQGWAVKLLRHVVNWPEFGSRWYFVHICRFAS